MADTADRADDSAGHCGDQDGAKAVHNGFVLACHDVAETLRTSKARTHPPITSIMLRYGSGQASSDEAILELYYTVPIAKIDEAAWLHWRERHWSRFVSLRAEQVKEKLGAISTRPIHERYGYVFLQAITLKHKQVDVVWETAVIAAIGIPDSGNRELLTVASARPDGGEWDTVLGELKRRGLSGTKLFVGENETKAWAAVKKHFPHARYQGCLNLLKADVVNRAPGECHEFIHREFAAMRLSVSREVALVQGAALVDRLRALRANTAAEILANALDFQFTYFLFPRAKRARLRDANFMKKLMTHVRERLRILGSNLEADVLVLMVAARFEYAAQRWNELPFLPRDAKAEAEVAVERSA